MLRHHRDPEAGAVGYDARAGRAPSRAPPPRSRRGRRRGARRRRKRRRSRSPAERERRFGHGRDQGAGEDVVPGRGPYGHPRRRRAGEREGPQRGHEDVGRQDDVDVPRLFDAGDEGVELGVARLALQGLEAELHASRREARRGDQGVRPAGALPVNRRPPRRAGDARSPRALAGSAPRSRPPEHLVERDGAPARRGARRPAEELEAFADPPYAVLGEHRERACHRRWRDPRRARSRRRRPAATRRGVSQGCTGTTRAHGGSR